MKRVIAFMLMVAMVFVLVKPAAADSGAGEDEFDRLRAKWRNYLTGGDMYGLPVQDPALQARIDSISAGGQSAWDSMNKQQGRTYLWEDAVEAKFPSSSYIYENYKRLYRMALAYSTKGSTLHGDAALLSDLIQGLDWVSENQYNEQLDWKVNYHHWEINIPTVLSNITTLLYEQLGSERVDHYMDAVHRFANDPTTYALSVVPSYGANRLSESLPIALRGILVKDGSRLALVRDRLSDYEALIYPYVQEGNGWYRDGSFISHDRHAYNGTYGLEQYSILITLMYLLDGSSWELTDPRVENVYQWTDDGYLPLVYNGRLMDMVNGRSTARQGASDHVQGNKLIDSLLILSEFAEPERASVYKQAIKAWMLGKEVPDYRDNASIPMLLRVNEIVQDASIPAAVRPVYMQYAGMDRAVQQRPGYAFGLSMFSNRIYDFETVNGENKKGWYTSSGMTYLYDDDDLQFNNNYWATVNMKRLPGITVDAEYDRPEMDSNKLSSKSWVGGVEIAGEYGASGMELEGYRTTLSAKKSWFAFDNEIVALGSDIDSADDRTIETVIENRKLKGSGGEALTVNGQLQPSTLGWSAALDDVRHIHLEGPAGGSGTGYVFPNEGTKVHALREERSGTWGDVSNQATDRAVYKNRFLNLWFDHGKNPTGGSYAYTLLPNRTAGEVADYSTQPDVTILEQNDYVHAVKENRLQLTSALFWEDVKRTVDQLITVDKKSAVAVRETGDELEVAVSDPTQENRGVIEVEIHRSAADVVASDPSIKVLSLSPTIKLAVQTGGSLGRTQSITFSKTGVETPPRLALSPVADASVHNGDDAAEPFGSASTMSAKDDGNERKNRKAYMKFDLASVETVNRAVLRAKTYNPEGTSAVLNVLGAGDGWNEQDMTWLNAPAEETGPLDSVMVNGMERYYEWDVTDYVRSQLAGDRTATLVVTGADYEGVNLALHSKEHSYGAPQLVIEGGFASGGPVPPEEPGYGEAMTAVLDQPFDLAAPGEQPPGWTFEPTSGSAIVLEQPGAMNDRELRLSGGSAGLTASIPFEAQDGLLYAQFRIRSEEASVPMHIDLLPAAGDSQAIRISMNGKGRMTASDGSSFANLQSYAANTWYKVKLVIDTQAGSYDVYIDEARKAARLEMPKQAAVHAIRFEAGAGGQFVIDEVAAGLANRMEPAPSPQDKQNSDVSDTVLPPYTVSDHFNVPNAESLVGWSLSEAGGTIELSDMPSEANRSLTIRNTGAGSTSATRLFDAPDGYTAVEFWLKPEQSNQTFGAPYIRDAGNRDIAIILFNNSGNITAFNGATSTVVTPYQAGKWYHMRVELDPNAKTYDLYINGHLAADNFGYRNTSSGRVSRLLFFSNALAGAMHIDNVRVISEDDEFEAPPPGSSPSIALDAPEEAGPGEAVQVKLDLLTMGYQIQPERLVLGYDENALDFEGLAAGDPAVAYDVFNSGTGELVITWTNGAHAEASESLPALNLRVKEAPGSTETTIRLFSSELYLLPDGVSVRTQPDEAKLTLAAETAFDYTVNDSFNIDGSEVPSGWQLNETGGEITLADIPDEDNRSLSIRNTKEGQTAAIRVFDPLEGEVTVEYWVRPEQRIQTFGAPYIKDAAGRDTAVILFVNNGTIQAYNGASAQTLMPYEAGQWYHMRMVADTESKTYDLYINGTLAADGFAFRNQGSAGIDKLQFFSNALMGTLLLDNVRVITEEDRASEPGPEEMPGLTLGAPEEVRSGELFQATLGLKAGSSGSVVRPERAVLVYDETLFQYEGSAEDVSGQIYTVQEGLPGRLILTWNSSGAAGGNSRAAVLNFRVKEDAEAVTGSLRVYTAELFLQPGGISVRAPEVEVVVRTVADLKAPVTVMTMLPETPDGANGWYASSVRIEFSATDDLSGVSRIEYSLNGGAEWLTAGTDSAELAFESDGEYRLIYRAVDLAGHMEAEREAAFRIDRTPPTAQVNVVTGAVYSNDEVLDLQVVTHDEGSGPDSSRTALLLDGQPIAPDENVLLYLLEPGPHTLSVSSSDMAGNSHQVEVVFHTETSAEALSRLVDLFEESGAIDNSGIANSLRLKLSSGELQAFLHHVEAQRGKHIAAQEADILIRDALALLNS
ncbi:polysaccharide lyase family 8 super-sandwich domain-containing protein [Paenibacillus sp. NPDC093718]|uniref:polysaccharide lyase family 8 super-sandwich domain-containing protein n=1 Tax=Paenibacillus sp. NPDC093718 TaxID=3390601 RepID=UPI003CFFD824